MAASLSRLRMAWHYGVLLVLTRKQEWAWMDVGVCLVAPA